MKYVCTVCGWSTEADQAPENQDVMVRGCRDAILTMIGNEPSGDGAQVPYYYK